jgi:hypothetical protein
MNPLIEQIKAQYRGGSMTIKLLIVNVSVFALIQLINALERLQIFSFLDGLPQGYVSQYLFARRTGLPATPMDTPQLIICSFWFFTSIWKLIIPILCRANLRALFWRQTPFAFVYHWWVGR